MIKLSLENTFVRGILFEWSGKRFGCRMGGDYIIQRVEMTCDS